MRNGILRLIPTLGLVVLLGSQLPAATITVGTHTLLANTAGQTIHISISGADHVQGMTSRVQIGDGGIPVPPGTSHSGPLISSLDALSGTIFSGGIQTPTPGNVFPQYREDVVDVASIVTVSGLLMTLTVDTTGFDSGTWALTLKDNIGGLGNETFLNNGSHIPLDITDGFITIQAIPEPSMLPLWGLLPVLGGVYFWRNRRSRLRQAEAAA